ncbi:MAG: hypothetical protein IT430_15660 [Phycisphaerales bacterium]|nr:hypothetical protein [Phycisphaerales bacterium]
MVDLQRLLAYDEWANRHMAAALAGARGDLTRGLRLLGHIAAVHELFLARATGSGPVVVWPHWDLREIDESLMRSSQGWSSLLQQRDAGEVIRYTNSKGEQWSNTIGEMAMHVALHSSYHRGQIAMLLAAVQATPPYTDFIQAARTGVV